MIIFTQVKPAKNLHKSSIRIWQTDVGTVFCWSDFFSPWNCPNGLNVIVDDCFVFRKIDWLDYIKIDIMSSPLWIQNSLGILNNVRDQTPDVFMLFVVSWFQTCDISIDTFIIGLQALFFWTFWENSWFFSLEGAVLFQNPMTDPCLVYSLHFPQFTIKNQLVIGKYTIHVWECLNPRSSAFSAFRLGLVGGCKLQQWHGDRYGVAGCGKWWHKEEETYHP